MSAPYARTGQSHRSERGLAYLVAEGGDDFSGDVERVAQVYRLSHFDCFVSVEVAGLHQPQHDFQAPNHRDPLRLAGLTQWAVVGQACPAVVSGQDQAELVLGSPQKTENKAR